jgi:alpha-mannosidase
MTYQERRLERLQRRIEEFRAWRNAREFPITDWTFTASDGNPRTLRLGDFWPVIETPVRLSAEASVPGEWAGEPVELELWLGGEGFVQFSTGFQAGLNPMHHRFPVTEQAAGDEFTIEAEIVPKGIFGSNLPEPRIERAHLVVPQRETRALERDYTMLLEACLQLGGHEVVPFLLDVAEASLSELASGWPTASDVAVSRYVLGYDNGLGSGTAAVPPRARPNRPGVFRPHRNGLNHYRPRPSKPSTGRARSLRRDWSESAATIRRWAGSA